MQDLDVSFASGKIPSGARAPENVYSVAVQEMAKHRAKFDWPLVRDVTPVMKARCETRGNLLGCPKLQNRSQPLVGRSSSYCEDMWRRYCCLTRLFLLSINALVLI